MPYLIPGNSGHGLLFMDFFRLPIKGSELNRVGGMIGFAWLCTGMGNLYFVTWDLQCGSHLFPSKQLSLELEEHIHSIFCGVLKTTTRCSASTLCALLVSKQ